MEGYRFTMVIPVRLVDVDAFGHVNHAAYFSYFEEARSAYYFQLMGRSGIESLGFVVAEACCRYRSPIRYPAQVRVGVRVSEIGSKSFRMEYEATDEGSRRRVADGHTVLVAYDYARRRSIPVPDEVRRAVESFEARPVGRDRRKGRG